jgi:putative acetyltransferase
MSRPGCLRTGFEFTDRDHFLLMNALIRLEQSSDVAAIDYVLRSAFPTDQEARLVGRLRKHQRLRLSLVAEIDDVIVGHIAFSEVTLAGSLAKSTGLGLAPLSIVAELQRRGLGAQLVGEGLRACERLGAGFVVVLGEPEYYHRFGFRRADLFGLKNEYGAGEAFMALELKTASITPGLVRYAPEFSDLPSAL